MYELKFTIENKHDNYLYRFFQNIDNKAYYWKIETGDIYWNKGIPFFTKFVYNNDDFFKTIKNKIYYMIFVDIVIEDDLKNEILRLEVIDCIFVKIICNNKHLFDQIIRNLEKEDIIKNK